MTAVTVTNVSTLAMATEKRFSRRRSRHSAAVIPRLVQTSSSEVLARSLKNVSQPLWRAIVSATAVNSAVSTTPNTMDDEQKFGR